MAAQRMRDEHVGALVVVETVNGSRIPIGVITDRDITVRAVAAGLDLDKTIVRDLHERDIVTSTMEEDVGAVLHRMRSFDVRRIPVRGEYGALVGIVTLDDVMSGISDELAEIASFATRQNKHER